MRNSTNNLFSSILEHLVLLTEPNWVTPNSPHGNQKKPSIFSSILKHLSVAVTNLFYGTLIHSLIHHSHSNGQGGRKGMELSLP